MAFKQTNNDYDVIVIGAGIGGLVCAANLVNQGMKVAVFEQHSKPGGYCSTFHRSGFTFDAAVHLIGGCEIGGIVGNIFANLGIEKEIEFIRVDPIYRLITPDYDIQLPCSLKGYFEVFARIFPEERQGLTKLASLVENVWYESSALLSSSLTKSFPLALSSVHTMNLLPLTFRNVLDEYVSSPKLKTLLAMFSGYGGLPAERMSGLYMLSILGSYLIQGAYYPRGGSQTIPNTLMNAINKRGGRVQLNTAVEQILVRDGIVQGVHLSSGEEITSSVVVSNADALHTFSLFDSTQLGNRFANRLKNQEVGMSAFQVYLGVEVDLKRMGLPDHEIIVLPSYDLSQLYSDLIHGNWTTVPLGITLPSNLDPSLARAGRHCVHLTLIVPSQLFDWRVHKQVLADQLVVNAGKIIPDLKSRIDVLEIATPLSLERFTRNRNGSCYGWAQTPEQVAMRRLRPKTPLKGLFLTGHWTIPGGGIVSVSSSGLRTSEMVLQYLG